MIISHPSSRSSHKKQSPLLPHSKPTNNSSDSDSPESYPSQELSFEDWVDKKLTQNEQDRMNKINDDDTSFVDMDKNKRKYYNKRNKRMYGSDSDDERKKLREKGEFVELKPEVVELRTLHKREEELFFYDTFALPWEKEKHYKMVYQLEKKYFPDQCLDKALLEPGMSNSKAKKKRVDKGEEEDKGLVFFEEGRDEENKVGKDGVGDISEKKVEEFFKNLKKVPNKNDEVSGVNEPFLASRSFGLPPKWDSPAGTVVLINKPKGEGSCFFVSKSFQL